MFFFLVQTEQGDIFKITMEVDEDMVSAKLFCCNNFLKFTYEYIHHNLHEFTNRFQHFFKQIY